MFFLVWTKVQEKVKSLGDKIKAKTKALIEKYKPKIINTINNVKQFIIEEGQKIIIELKGDLVEIIVKETGANMEKRSIKDKWNERESLTLIMVCLLQNPKGEIAYKKNNNNKRNKKIKK